MKTVSSRNFQIRDINLKKKHQEKMPTEEIRENILKIYDSPEE